ncbi:MAG: hypothetical protein WKF79_04715 [Nocardioides sp.]
MTKGRVAAVVLAVCVLVLNPKGALADGDGDVKVETAEGGIHTGVTHVEDPIVDPGVTDLSIDDGAPVVDVGTGIFDQFCSGTNWSPGCVPDEVGDVLPTVTPGVVEQAFREIPLPPSELVVQPPNGRTLVNFETNFYTETEEFTRTLTLLGQQVELRIWPAEFGWRFGDGEELWTTEAGAPYPDLEVTHNYQEKGDVSPKVDTTYAAEFRVNGGPWQPVPGTVTIPGAPVGLEVVEASPLLVG